MDESDLQADGDEEENLRNIEKDVDEFLLSIKENESKSTDLQNEGACSKAHDEYDTVSSDDCFEESLPSRNEGPSIPCRVGKLPYGPFKICKMGKGNVKNYGKPKFWSNFPRKEWHRHNGIEFGQISREHHQKSFPPRWREESFSPSSDEFQQERSRSPRSDYDRGQSFSPSGRKKHQGVRRVSPNRKGNYPQQREFVPRGRHGYRRRNFYQEEVDELSQDRYVFEERNSPHERTFASRSRSNDDGNTSHRELSRGSNSPIDWSENYDYDLDYEPWRCEENHPYVKKDRNGQSAASLVTTILRKAVAHNPDIAIKVTKACLALISKPAETDYECDRDSWAVHEQQSGKVFPQSWRRSRSPSFSKSLNTLNNHLGVSHHSNRFHGHSKRSVLERSISPDDRQAGRDKCNYPDRHKKERYSPHKRLDDMRPSSAASETQRARFHGHSKRSVLEHSLSPNDRQAERDKYNYLDRHKKERYSPEYKRLVDTRPSAAPSETQRARKRSPSEQSKNHLEEEFDLKGAVSWSIRKIKKQCKTEEISVVRHALLSLLEVHKRECKMYMKKPEAHPDHKKEYRKFVEQKTKTIVDLGGDPNGYDFEQDWRKHWPVQMYKLFQESWNTKMHSCTSMLQNMHGSGSVSSHSSSRKSSTKQPHEKQRTHEQGSEEETVDIEESIKKVKTSKTKRKLSEVTHSNVEDQQMCKKQEEMNNEIFSILKLLNHIKHRFKDCEASFDKLYVKAMSLKEDSVAINDVLQGDLPLLRKIDEKLKETLKDVNLTLIQKAVIQETHERFSSFLKKSREIHST